MNVSWGQTRIHSPRPLENNDNYPGELRAFWGLCVRHKENQGWNMRLCAGLQMASQRHVFSKLPYKTKHSKPILKMGKLGPQTPDLTLPFFFSFCEKKQISFNSRLNEDGFQCQLLLPPSTQPWDMSHCGPFYVMLAGDKTQGLRHAKLPLYQLSYLPSLTRRLKFFAQSHIAALDLELGVLPSH